MPNKTLYVNSDSHFSKLHQAGDLFKPIKAEQTAPGLLAAKYGLDMVNQSRAGGSNQRIIRTSKEYLRDADPKNTVVFIAWTQWHRTEWFYQGQWVQISGHPMYHDEVPDDPAFRNFWAEWTRKISTPYPVGDSPDALFDPMKVYMLFHGIMIDWQSRILDFHHWLEERRFRHVFLHADQGFLHTPMDIVWPNDLWVGNDPYDWNYSFCNYASEHGHHYDEYCHYDADAHLDYSQFIEPWVVRYLGLA